MDTRLSQDDLLGNPQGDPFAQARNIVLNQLNFMPRSRKELEVVYVLQDQDIARHSAAVYPGTCRDGLNGKPARAWRLNVQAVVEALHLPQTLQWHDRRMGHQQQDVAREVGDFVLKRADGFWAYQLAVVVDDADQGITHVVRGEDLHDNTARQILLQKALGFPTPIYMHKPLVMGENGEKLSKQNGALALDLRDPLATLNMAAKVLRLNPCETSIEDALYEWTQAWLTSKSLV